MISGTQFYNENKQELAQINRLLSEVNNYSYQYFKQRRDAVIAERESNAVQILVQDLLREVNKPLTLGQQLLTLIPGLE